MMKKKNTLQDPEKEIKITFDPIVPCQWIHDKEVRLSEWNKMVTYYIRHYNKEKYDAQPLYIKKSSD